jgi:CTP:molybdopterin cytidylyltransferase MocA
MRPGPGRNREGGMTAVILAAGSSRRMGAHKGLLRIDGVPMLQAHAEAFASAGLPVRVVLGPELAEHVAVLPYGVEVVWNARWARSDMVDSLALGLEGLTHALVTPVDVPPAHPRTIAALAASTGPAVPTWSGRDGHPVRVSAPHPPGRLDVRLVGAPRVPVADPDCVRNLNDVVGFAEWLAARRARVDDVL